MSQQGSAYLESVAGAPDLDVRYQLPPLTPNTTPMHASSMKLSLLTALWAGSTAASQIPLSSIHASPDLADALIVTHEAHPEHSLTITRHHPSVAANGEGNRIAGVCPGATGGYTGYLNKGDKHFYFAYC